METEGLLKDAGQTMAEEKKAAGISRYVSAPVALGFRTVDASLSEAG